MIVSGEAEAAALAARGVVFDLVLSEGEHSAQGLGTSVLRLGTDATAPDALNPYDQTSLLRAVDGSLRRAVGAARSEEHTSELQSLMRISYAVFCLQKKKHKHDYNEMHNSAKTTTTKQIQ